MTKLLRTITIGVATLLLLTGCNKEPEAESSDPYESVLAETKEVSTDCGLLYMEFLKYGGMSTEDVTAEFPTATFTTTDCVTAGHTHDDGEVGSGEEMWEYDNGLEDRFTYKRVLCNMYSTLTKTFKLSELDINAWVDIEVQGLDALSGSKGERQQVDGTTWAYEWNSYLENYKLQVYSTGVTGEYIGLISFSRQGETTLNQDAIVDERGASE